MIWRRGGLFAPVLVAILLHLPATGHDFVFDDRGAILENPFLRRIEDLPKAVLAPWWNATHAGAGLYRPVTTASFAVDRALAGGFRAGWFHLVNVLLHGAVTWLVTLLALLVLESPAGAIVAGLLFAVHPVHVEAVAGIVGRAEILAAGFCLAGLLLHRAALSRPGRAGIAALVAAPAAILLAVLSKESAFVAPALVLGLDILLPAPASSRRRRWALYGAYGAVVVAALFLRGRVLGGLGMGGAIPFVDNPAAAAGPLAGRLTALTCVIRYAGLLVWPARLSVDYSYDQLPLARGAGDPMALCGLALVALILVAGLVLLRRRHALGFALAFMACAMAPTSNLVIFIGTLLAERLLYLPSVGLCLLAGWVVSRQRTPGASRASLAVALAVVVAAGARTGVRLPEWKDDFTLYRSAAVVSPRSARIRYNLGNAWLKRREFAHAEEQYRAAIAIYPGFGDARANLGMTLLQEGRPREALEALEEAARMQPRNAEVAVNLGSAWRSLGDTTRAEEEFRRAIGLTPGAATAWNNLGSLAMARGDVTGALDSLAKAVAADPGYAIYHVNMADALMAANRAPEAVAEFERAAGIDPDLPESHRGLGEIALRRGDAPAAEREFRLAAYGDPPSARAANFLGYLLSQRGDAQGAAALYERALSIDPTLYDAHRSLGLLYASVLADPRKAEEHFRRSLALAPDQPGADELRRWIDDLGRRRNRPRTGS